MSRAVAILDPRVRTRPYGRVFLQSLPPARQVIGESDMVFDAMQRFLSSERG
jgi:Rad3-related DNA helicase